MKDKRGKYKGQVGRTKENMNDERQVGRKEYKMKNKAQVC